MGPAEGERLLKTITLEHRGHIVLIGLNRPHKMGAFDRTMLRELSEAYSEYEANPALRCAVLFAHGDQFTAGLDLADVGPAVARGEALFPVAGIDPLDTRAPRRTKPVVCAVQGWCLTIGIELLLASDIRVAAEDTRFGQIEVGRGIMPFGGATVRLPQVAGWGNAMRWLLTGERFDAAEAYRIGLVQELTPVGKQLERAVEIAERVASQAPLGVCASLANARTAVEQGPEEALRAVVEQARKLMHSEDAHEGMQSFIERRDARFQGK